MKRAYLAILVLATFFVLVPPKASACVSCIGQCLDTCCARCCCNCAVCERCCTCCGLSPARSFLDTPHPGFLAAQQAGKLLVTAVLPHSPAAAADVRIGDEIREVQHDGAVRTCGNNYWGTSEQRRTMVVIHRAGVSISKEIELLSMGRLPELALGAPPKLVLANRLTERTSAGAEIAWGLGIRWQTHRSGVLVVSVFDSFPASKGDLRPGDVIAGVDGTDGLGAVAPMLKSSASRPLRHGVKLHLIRHGRQITLNLGTLTFSEAIRQLAAASGAQPTQVASAR